MAVPLAVFVFIYVACVHAYRLSIPSISKKILKKLKTTSKAEDEKRSQLQLLQDQLADISMKDEFAKYAKLERKINKLKEELKSLKNSKVASSFTMSWGLTLALNTIYTIFIVGLIWTYRYEPILILDGEWAWPVGWLLAFPCGVPGAVGITAWLAICSAVVVRMQGTVSDVVKPKRKKKAAKTS